MSTPKEIRAIISWVWADKEGNERPLMAIIPSPAGGEAVNLTYDEGNNSAEGYDAIARQYARSGRVLAFKRRYVISEELEVVDGRVSRSPR